MIAIALTVALLFSAVALTLAVSRPHTVLYALAAVVSIVGIHIFVGITFYLSRIVVILFIFSIALRLLRAERIRLPAQFLSNYIFLFGLILFFQLFSVMLSAQVADGLRQIFIYLSVMALFLVVITVATSVEVIIKAIKIYLWAGLIQGLYGIYQVVGGPLSWPTYQNLMAQAGIPTSNDHTTGGYIYSGMYHSFRAIGFYPADMSHYAGYMVGVLLLAISFLVYNRRMILPYFVILFGGAGLILSLSRSGILAFIIFGIPALFFLLSRVRPPRARSLSRTLILPGLLGVVLIFVIGGPLLSTMDVALPDATEILSTRLADLSNPGTNKDESMNEHIATKLAGLDALMSSPMLGVGLGVNASPWWSETYHRGWGGSHSHHLDILGQTGLIGAGLQFLFMLIVGRYMWKGLFVTSENSLERHLLAGLLASYVAILFGNFMYHYFTLDIVWFLMGCGVALSRILILNANNKFTTFVERP